jgi:hypothetical protein
MAASPSPTSPPRSAAPSPRPAAASTATARHPHVALAAATSGATNLLLGVGCHDDADLYDYVAHHLGPIDGVQAVQTAPVIRTVKRAGSLLEAAPGH